MHAVEIHARDGQVAAAVCSNGEQNRVESLLTKLGDLEVAAGALIEFQRDVSGPEDLAHLRFDNIARQAIFGDAQVEHSPGDWSSLKNGYRISHQRQVVRRRKTDWAATHHGHLKWQGGLNRVGIHIDVAFGFRSVALRKKAL